VSRLIDYLIVGQGLAGSLLSCLFELYGCDVVIIDNAHRTAASVSAAGIMNPITGGRLNRPHLVDTLLAAAFRVYPQIEALLGTEIFQRRTVLRLLQSELEQRQWETRLASGEYAKYIAPSVPPASNRITTAFGGFEVIQAGHLDVPHFVKAVRNKFLAKHRLVETELNYSDIRPLDSNAEWRDYKARGIIFCEGYQMFKNPYFNQIELNPAKGEILTLDAPGFSEERILQHGKWLFRTQSGLVKAGTTYSWAQLDETPTVTALDQIEEGVRKFIKAKFAVVDHTAGVRPIIRVDNRPIIGRHPHHRSLAILNGLGSKGVLQAPFAAEQLIAQLERDKPVHPDFDVCRNSLWQRPTNV
jgi:glycine oxidase